MNIDDLITVVKQITSQVGMWSLPRGVIAIIIAALYYELWSPSNLALRGHKQYKSRLTSPVCGLRQPLTVFFATSLYHQDKKMDALDKAKRKKVEVVLTTHETARIHVVSVINYQAGLKRVSPLFLRSYQ